MATKNKASSAEKSGQTITRITASDKKPAAVKEAKPSKADVSAEEKPKKSFSHRLASPFVALGRYFKGAWYELKQVRWPNRKATWSLTVAVIVFTLFFALLILLLDASFKYLFELMLGS